MPRIPVIEQVVELPENIEAIVEGQKVIVRGPKGEVQRNFSDSQIRILKENNKIKVLAGLVRKKEKARVGTYIAHIKNMIKGVTEGFEYRLKIVYSHFPLTVEPKRKEVLIKNYIGERSPRIAKVHGEKTTVRVEGDDVIVEGINKEDVAQTAANIQQSTRLRGRLRKDFRVFMDGVYIYSKGK